MADAVTWLFDNNVSGGFGIDTSAPIFIMGRSSGAIAGMTMGLEQKGYPLPVKIAAFVSEIGTTIFGAETLVPALLKGDRVPTIGFQGDLDGLIPYAEVLAFLANLTAADVPNKLLTVVGGGHSVAMDTEIDADTGQTFRQQEYNWFYRYVASSLATHAGIAWFTTNLNGAWGAFDPRGTLDRNATQIIWADEINIPDEPSWVEATSNLGFNSTDSEEVVLSADDLPTTYSAITGIQLVLGTTDAAPSADSLRCRISFDRGVTFSAEEVSIILTDPSWETDAGSMRWYAVAFTSIPAGSHEVRDIAVGLTVFGTSSLGLAVLYEEISGSVAADPAGIALAAEIPDAARDGEVSTSAQEGEVTINAQEGEIR